MKGIKLLARIREILGKKSKTIRRKGLLPAIVYGPKQKPLPLELNYQDFEKVYKEVGESSLIALEIDYSPKLEKRKEILVLIHGIQKDPITEKFLHVDFYQPLLTEEVETKIPLIFEGESKAIKELGGTLIKNITELEIKALPQNLPKEIKVDISSLKNLEDHILIKDLKLPKEIKILKDPQEILAWVAPPEKVEEELEKPIEEKIEVEKIEEKKERGEGT